VKQAGSREISKCRISGSPVLGDRLCFLWIHSGHESVLSKIGQVLEDGDDLFRALSFPIDGLCVACPQGAMSVGDGKTQVTPRVSGDLLDGCLRTHPPGGEGVQKRLQSGAVHFAVQSGRKMST
jgi:hypothetical protein